MIRLQRGITTAAAVLAMSSCFAAAEDMGKPATGGDPGDFAQLVESYHSIDFDPVGSPDELAKMADLTVLARLEEISGTGIIQSDLDLPEYQRRTVFFVVGSIDSVISQNTSRPYSDGDQIELRFPLGAIPVDTLSEVLPRDSRVLLFLDESATDESLSGRPVLEPFPQGMVFDGANGPVPLHGAEDIWSYRSFDALLEDTKSTGP